MLPGTRPVRKSNQAPVFSGAAALAASTELLRPGSVSRPRPMPIADGDQRGDREPQQGLAGQPGGVGDLLEVGDADDHGGDDQRRDQRLQQRHEGAADGLQGAGQPVGRAVGDGADLTGDEAEGDAQDEGEEYLRRERDAAETSEHEEVPFGGCRRGRGGRLNRPRSSSGRSPARAGASGPRGSARRINAATSAASRMCASRAGNASRVGPPTKRRGSAKAAGPTARVPLTAGEELDGHRSGTWRSCARKARSRGSHLRRRSQDDRILRVVGGEVQRGSREVRVLRDAGRWRTRAAASQTPQRA